MVFSSATFLFLFLPIVYVLYRIIPSIPAKNGFLILVSLLFYAFGEPFAVFLMIGSVLLSYLCGLGIAKGKKWKTACLVLGIAGNLGVLCVYKYAVFFLQALNAVFPFEIPVPQIELPIGISFFIFQSISYVIDVSRKEIEVQKNPFYLLLYVSFFPQLIAGPIVKYHDIAEMITNRTVTASGTAQGMRRFICGLSKKLLIANVMGQAADTVFGLDADLLSMPSAWLGAICYTLQIYFDFSGYSDMAIGLGAIMGFDLGVNFDHPFRSLNITEFWRRWHISLSSWIRDYVYISLGGNRKGDLRTCFNIFITMLLAGLWHGASWNFVIWGALFGLAQVVHRTFRVNILHHDRHYRSQGVKRFFAVLSTFVFVLFTFMVFRNADMQGVVDMLTQMFTKFHPEVAVQCVTGYVWVFVLVVFGFVSHWLPQAWESRMVAYLSKCNLLVYVLLLTGVIFLICQVKTSDVQPFIYFQF